MIKKNLCLNPCKYTNLDVLLKYGKKNEYTCTCVVHDWLYVMSNSKLHPVNGVLLKYALNFTKNALKFKIGGIDMHEHKPALNSKCKTDATSRM